jgi:hypothetical protein
MMTVRPAAAMAGAHAHGMQMEMDGAAHAPAMAMPPPHATRPPLPVMTLLSFLALAAGVALGLLLRRV